jgi:hypothetical protein
VTPTDYRGFNMKAGVAWSSKVSVGGVVLRDLILAEDYALLLSQPAGLRIPAEPTAAPQALRMQAFRRSAVDNKGTESGLLDYDEFLKEPSGIVNWQVVNGGLYYADNQQRLHFLSSGGK